MRKRRQPLQVTTFPFLAVLLCTMGSLILLLLVMDRRARLVARARAEQQAALIVERHQQETRQRQQEWEQARQALRVRLQQQWQAVQQQRGQMQAQIADAIQQKTGTEAALRELQAQCVRQKAELARQEQELVKMQGDLAARSRQTEASRTQLARLTADLLALEKALADLKALRQQQEQTYSLVPYRGKHGENRYPIYVECTARSVIFHPDRVTFSGYAVAPTTLRAEIDRRLAQQRQALSAGQTPNQAPYVLLLLRPSGIENFYQFQHALAGLKVDFGYELVDEDWVLDFSALDGSAPQPWMISGSGASGGTIQGQGADNSPAQASRMTARGQRTGTGPSQPTGAFGAPAEAGRDNAGNERNGIASDWRGGNVAERSESGGPPGANALRLPLGRGAALGFPAIGTGNPGSVPQGQGHSEPPGSSPRGGTSARVPGSAVAQAGSAGPTQERAPLSATPPQPPHEKPHATAAPAGQPASSPTPSGKVSATGQADRAGDESAAESAPGSEGQGSDGAGVARALPLQGLPQKRSRPLRLSSNRDWVIAIECTADAVVLTATGQRFSLASMAAQPGRDNPLLAAVQQLIARRQATVRRGEPAYRPQLRFLVDADGLRAFYLAYPALEPLQLTMTRENRERPE